MLKRETCEALRVLPEVREHEFSHGELAWVKRSGHPSFLGRYNARDDIFYPADGDLSGDVAFIGVPGWAPTLSDLLAMALARAIRPVSLMHVREWEFGEWGYGPEDVDDASGATPEEAVAAWLLARAR